MKKGSNKNAKIINTSDLNTGVYFVQINYLNKVKSLQLIIK